LGRHNTGCYGIKAFKSADGSAGPAARTRNPGNSGSGSKFLLTFQDGSVGVFDLAKQRMQWSGSAGHSETVFDCRFQPSNPLRLATARFEQFDSSFQIFSACHHVRFQMIEKQL
jgi:hypothetical protein